jgi:hypothetical protein
MDAEQHCGVGPANKADDEECYRDGCDDADRKPVAFEQASERSRPSIGLIAIATEFRQRLRHVDIEFMRRSKLTIVQAGTATVAEVCQVVEISVGERAAHLHGRKDRTKAFAVPAGIADRHQPVGLGKEGAGMKDLGCSVNVHAISIVAGAGRLARTSAAASRPAMRPNTLPIVMPIPAA